jgi:hypothetical protein
MVRDIEKLVAKGFRVVEEDDKRGVVILENDEWRVRVPHFGGLPTWDKKKPVDITDVDAYS